MLATELAPFVDIQGMSKEQIAEKIAALLLQVEDIKGRCAMCKTLTNAEIEKGRRKRGKVKDELAEKLKGRTFVLDCPACGHHWHTDKWPKRI